MFKDDLKTLGLDVTDIESVTIRDVIKAFRKNAHILHPDRAGHDSTTAFQELSNSYQRALKYLVDKINPNENKVDDDDVDVRFAKDNFSRCNFPKKNSDSFTVCVENELADAWQECFENLYGKPVVNKNKTSGTESGRV